MEEVGAGWSSRRPRAAVSAMSLSTWRSSDTSSSPTRAPPPATTCQAHNVEEGVTPPRSGRTPVEVIGFVSDMNFNGQGGSRGRTRPPGGAPTGREPSTQLLRRCLAGAGDADIADEIDVATAGVNRTTRDRGRARCRGAAGNFNQIMASVGRLVVIGLFFALLTVERLSLYASAGGQVVDDLRWIHGAGRCRHPHRLDAS